MLLLMLCFTAALPAFGQSTGDIVDRLDKALGVTLPSEYPSKLKAFVQSSRIFKNEDACALTEQFIKDEMKKDWGISKQNQLLFVWTALNEKINGEYLYNGSDGDEKRIDEIDKVMETFEDCGNRCEMAMAQTLKCTLKELAKLYNLYQQAPQAERKIINPNDCYEECKKNNIDYKAILMQELGDKKKVEDLLKFFGVE